MKSLSPGWYALTGGVVVLLLAGCGGSQPPIGATGALSQAAPIRATSSYTVLHHFSFKHERPSAAPSSGLIVVNGALYGTTVDYPAEDAGTAYSLSTAGLHKTLHTFHVPDGTRPYGTLLDVNGTLYGTTTLGGSAGDGAVFSLSTSGSEKVLYSFQGGSDGARPKAGLIDVNGTLYGTTLEGGDGEGSNCNYSYVYPGCGTVFSISTSGAYKLLYSFQGGSDGANPLAPLVNVNGTLYGTTVGGGSSGNGTVYTITPSGSEHVLYSFQGGSDGADPMAPLVDANGTLYGTTNLGGSGSTGSGTVYTITTSGSESVLYSFTGGSDGANPEAGLYDLDGTLYGTTRAGGTGTCNSPSSTCGVVFSLSAAGKEQVLHDFGDGRHDGANPSFGSLVSVNGTLYGTTTYGGGPGCNRDGCGIAYALTP